MRTTTGAYHRLKATDSRQVRRAKNAGQRAGNQLHLLGILRLVGIRRAGNFGSTLIKNGDVRGTGIARLTIDDGCLQGFAHVFAGQRIANVSAIFAPNAHLIFVGAGRRNGE